MKNRIERNRASAQRIVRALDEASLRMEDPMLLLRLGRLRNLAMDSRTDNPAAPRLDRRTLGACRRLAQRLRDGAALWELLAPLGEIERGLFDRERRPDAETPLYEQKRRLFDRLRELSAEADGLSLRRRQLAQQGAGLEEGSAAAELCRQEYEACGRRLRHLNNACRQTGAALQAMVSVQLLASEEAMLKSLERDCEKLPDPDELERRQLRLTLMEESLQRRAEAVAALREDSGRAAPVRNVVLEPLSPDRAKKRQEELFRLLSEEES